ncbi:MAG: hypothetical protein ACXVCY_16265 [Pseudobdellovibrionaceae bacterium]
MKKYFSALLILFLFCGKARAEVLLELGGTYFSDSLATSSTVASTKYFYNLDVLFNFKKDIWGGWNYSGFSYNDAGTTTTTLSSQDTGPAVKWQFGKGNLYNVSAAYNILSKATYSSGSTAEDWQGTSIWLQFAFAPEVNGGLHVGAALNYYSASYSKKTVNNIESAASNTRAWIFPTLMMTKEW